MKAAPGRTRIVVFLATVVVLAAAALSAPLIKKSLTGAPDQPEGAVGAPSPSAAGPAST